MKDFRIKNKYMYIKIENNYNKDKEIITYVM